MGFKTNKTKLFCAVFLWCFCFQGQPRGVLVGISRHLKCDGTTLEMPHHNTIQKVFEVHHKPMICRFIKRKAGCLVKSRCDTFPWVTRWKWSHHALSTLQSSPHKVDFELRESAWTNGKLRLVPDLTCKTKQQQQKAYPFPSVFGYSLALVITSADGSLGCPLSVILLV